MQKLLLIEDDYSYSEALIFFLQQNNFDVIHCDNGSDGLSQVSQDNFDLIILDVNLPDLDGYEILNRIKNKNQNAKIILATAKDDIEDKIKAFKLGAEDFLCKPFNPLELLARINVRLDNHVEEIIINEKIDEHTILKYDQQKDLILYNKTILNLTPNEKKLLVYLIEHKNQIIDKEVLYEHLNAHKNNRTIDLLVSAIRKKIEVDPKNPKYLKSLYGQGILLDI